jgi:hypothetical protein
MPVIEPERVRRAFSSLVLPLCITQGPPSLERRRPESQVLDIERQDPNPKDVPRTLSHEVSQVKNSLNSLKKE